MAKQYKLAIWNANGLSQHRQEIQTFITNQKIDIMLVSETHFTSKNYLKIHNYSTYNTTHPDGTAHGGTAIIIRNNIKHYEADKYQHEHIQATNIVIEDWHGPITVSAIYCPPKHTIKETHFSQFFQLLGHRFIAGGDYNAKHQQWGSRLATPRGRELYKTVMKMNLEAISTGEPTYWPTDPKKIPDVIDICIAKGLPNKNLQAESCLDLSSDHSPVIITMSSQIIKKVKPTVLCNKKTDWERFRSLLIETLQTGIPLKTENDVTEAIELFNNCIQQAAWNSTPTNPANSKQDTCSISIREKIAQKRKLRKQWQTTRSPEMKTKLNRAIKEIQTMLKDEKEQAIKHYLKGLSATETTDYSLWKATKRLKRPQISNPPIRTPEGAWAKSNIEKAELSADHLERVFTPNPGNRKPEADREILQSLNEACQQKIATDKFTIKEVKKVIMTEIDTKKSPGYDLITGKILKELPDVGFKYLTQLFNAALRISFFPLQWKVAKIIMIPKPGKSTEEVTSYRPISLLPVVSKVLEKLLHKRLLPIINKDNLIPNYQFGFRQQHATVEQVHRIVNKIHKSFERKQICSAVFLDITQAFDKVWHTGLLYKIKKSLPENYYLILRSYLEDRHFLVNSQDAYTNLRQIRAGVPQGSVLGPMLYLLFTNDLPTTPQVLTATYADDTAIVASSNNAVTATQLLQSNINKIQEWLEKWRIKINESKSTHVTFTTRIDTSPPITLNNKVIPQSKEVKYLGIHLDRRLTWQKHIFTKRKQLGIKLRKMYWLIGPESKLSVENKILLYKSILKPIWTYGLQLWGSAAKSNIEILQRFQSKMLRIIINAPWFMTNEEIHKDLDIPYVNEEILRHSTKYSNRLNSHPNTLATKLMARSRRRRRLKRKLPCDLTNYN